MEKTTITLVELEQAIRGKDEAMAKFKAFVADFAQMLCRAFGDSDDPSKKGVEIASECIFRFWPSGEWQMTFNPACVLDQRIANNAALAQLAIQISNFDFLKEVISRVNQHKSMFTDALQTARHIASVS